MGHGGQRADGLHPDALELGLRNRPDAPQLPHRERMEHLQLLFRWDDIGAIGFGFTGADLGKLLAGARTDGTRQARFLADERAQAVRPLLYLVRRRTHQRLWLHKGLIDG